MLRQIHLCFQTGQQEPMNDHARDVAIVMIRYCCRLCTSAEVYRVIRDVPGKDMRAALRGIKKRLDDGTKRNRIYRAVWQTARRGRPCYTIDGPRHGLSPKDLRICFHALTQKEQEILVRRDEPREFTEQQIQQVLNATSRLVRNTVRTKLRFLFRYDDALSSDDMVADLQAQAVRVIRNYEVNNITVEEMIPLVARGIANHAKNIASYRGHEDRNPLRRLIVRTKSKVAWYCDVLHDRVVRATVLVEQRKRKGRYVLAVLPEGKRYVYVARLYDDDASAKYALSAWRRGQDSTRSVMIDLSPDQTDDYTTSLSSLDRKVSDDTGGCTLHDILPDSSYDAFEVVDHILDVGGSATNEELDMTRLVASADELFVQYCERKAKRPYGTIPHNRIRSLVRRFVHAQQLSSACAQPTTDCTPVLPADRNDTT